MQPRQQLLRHAVHIVMGPLAAAVLHATLLAVHTAHGIPGSKEHANHAETASLTRWHVSRSSSQALSICSAIAQLTEGLAGTGELMSLRVHVQKQLPQLKPYTAWAACGGNTQSHHAHSAYTRQRLAKLMCDLSWSSCSWTCTQQASLQTPSRGWPSWYTTSCAAKGLAAHLVADMGHRWGVSPGLLLLTSEVVDDVRLQAGGDERVALSWLRLRLVLHLATAGLPRSC